MVNNGPSVVSQTSLVVKCPLKAHGHWLLYPLEVVTEGPLSCFSKTTLNALKLKVRTHTYTFVVSLFLTVNTGLCLLMTPNVFMFTASAWGSRGSSITEVQC